MKKISAEQLYEAMNAIGDDLLLRSEEESLPAKRRKQRRGAGRIVWLVAAAAALLVIALVGKNVLRFGQEGMSSAPAPAAGGYLQESAKESARADKADAEAVFEAAEEAADEDSEVREAAESESLSEKEESGASVAQDSVAPMALQACFAFDGRVYVEIGRTEDDSVIGEYVTTIEETTDEQTDAGVYKDNTGTVRGDVYTVNRHDLRKRLCMPQTDGTILLFEARGD